MDILHAIILGIIQGLTEFLPVSSSGHLEIAKVLLSEDNVVKSSLLMTVVLHGATACATIYIFRKDIQEIIRGIFKFKQNEEFLFSVKIILFLMEVVVLMALLIEISEDLSKISLVEIYSFH